MKVQKLFPLLVIAAGLLGYHNTFTGGFVSDDFESISENPTIRHLWPIWQPLSPPHRDSWLPVEGRPLINLSLAINYALGGTDVRGYHALNLIVHILAGLTLLGIVRRTLLQPRLRGRFGASANELALVTAVLWTVHPLQTESVTYIVQRAESIMGLLYLLTLYCFIRGTDSPRYRLWYSLSVVACALGMASKEVMVSAPLMVLLYDRAFISDSFQQGWRRCWPLFLGLASTWIVLVFVEVSAGIFAHASTTAHRYGLTWWQRLGTQPGVILYYLRLSVWPSPLSLTHPWPIANTWASILPPTVLVVILLGVSAWAWRTNPVWGFVGAWFFLILAPSSSIIPLHELIVEHRMYLSLAAVVSLAVMGLYSLMGRRCLAMLAVVAIGLGFLTWRRNQDYRNEITIRVDAVTKFPDSFVAHYYLGVALQRAGQMEQAIGHYEQAVRLNPDYANAQNNLGVALDEVGRVQEAISHYEQTLRIRPDDAGAHNNLGGALVRLGRVSEAITRWEQALRIRPDYAEVHYNLGLALWQAGKQQEAIAHWEQALRIKPDYVEAHNNLGGALVRLGRVSEAIGHYEQAAQINPDYAKAHYNLGVALEKAGRMPEAIEHYQQALRIEPDFTEAQNRLARLRAVQ